MTPEGGKRYTLNELLGPERRNWVHLVSPRHKRTLCGFGEADYPMLLWRNELAAEQNCTDCLRVLTALQATTRGRLR